MKQPRDPEEALDRRAFIGLVVPGVLAVPVGARAQQPATALVIGFLSGASLSSIQHRVEAFRQGLRDLGYVEGRNIAIEWRSIEGKLDQLAARAAELVRLKVDIIVAAGAEPVIRAAQQATRTIPIVMANASDPVGSGLVASLARPGGNITGLSTTAGLEIYGKQMQLLKEAIPGLGRLAILSNPANPFSALATKETDAAARFLRLSLQRIQARSPDEFAAAFAAAAKERADALLVVQDAVFFGHRIQLAELAARNRLPTMFAIPEHGEVGGLMAYAANRTDLFRRAATYVDKIAKGTKAGDLPIEQPTRFELVINRASRES